MPYQLTGATLYPYGPATRFTISGVQPPAAGYLGPSDQLSVSVTSPNAPINFSLALRYLDLTGNVQPLLYEVKAAATGGTPFVLPIQLAEGFLLSAVAFGATVQRGQCWVQFVILRQKAADTTVVAAVILQGYVSETDNVAYPGTQEYASIMGRGCLREIMLPAPGLVTPGTLTVPPGVRWLLRSVQTDFQQPNDDSFPTPVVQVFDASSNLIGQWFSFESINNEDAVQTWSAAPQASASGYGAASNTLPADLRLLAGWSIVVTAQTNNPATWILGPLLFIVEELVEL